MSEKVDIFMPIYIGDYLKDTRRLSAAEHGAYLLLMFDYWQGGALPNNDAMLSRITAMSAEEWAKAKDIVLSFFELKNDKLHHARIDTELKKAKANKKKKVERAKKGAEARWEKERQKQADATSNATSKAISIGQAKLDSMHEQCPSTSPTTSPTTVTTTTPSHTDTCERVRSAFVEITGKSVPTISQTAHQRIKRLESDGISFDQIKATIENAKNNNWVKSNGTAFTLEWILKPETFNKYVNACEKFDASKINYDNV